MLVNNSFGEVQLTSYCFVRRTVLCTMMDLFLLHRSLDTFWPTTGMFPQEFIISFSALMSIGNIKVLSSNGKQAS